MHSIGNKKGLSGFAALQYIPLLSGMLQPFWGGQFGLCRSIGAVEIGTALFWQEKHSEVQGYLRSSNGAFARCCTDAGSGCTDCYSADSVGAGIYVAVDNDDEDLPTSP
jgi:hypothetical protein